MDQILADSSLINKHTQKNISQSESHDDRKVDWSVLFLDTDDGEID